MDVERIVTELGLDIAKTRGKEISAHCPFHNDRTPSFSINQDTGAWICYSRCGGGGVVELVSRVLEVNNKSAREWLKERGQPSALRRKSRAAKTAKRKADKDAEPKPCPPFALGRIPVWITSRGFSTELLTEYQCGYSPFHDALVIPVLQSHALIYRRAPGREPRYKFTEDFRSHSTFYGLPNVTLGLDGSLILVEGPLDVLWLRQHGYGNSLAIMGGGRLGMAQRRILKEDLKPKKLILAFDNDEGGQTTATKSVNAVGKLIPCYVVQWDKVDFTDEDDDEIQMMPDDVAELSPEKLAELLATAVLTKKESRKKISETP